MEYDSNMISKLMNMVNVLTGRTHHVEILMRVFREVEIYFSFLLQFLFCSLSLSVCVSACGLLFVLCVCVCVTVCWGLKIYTRCFVSLFRSSVPIQHLSTHTKIY